MSHGCPPQIVFRGNSDQRHARFAGTAGRLKSRKTAFDSAGGDRIQAQSARPQLHQPDAALSARI
jgi:hypothetical protein